jgi:hypothetical protein
MRLVRISHSQFLNLDSVTRMEVFVTEDLRYMTVHFASGTTYRCTEEETEVLYNYVESSIENPTSQVSE